MTLFVSAMTFSERLRFKRQRSRVRQKDLVEMLGLSPQTVSAWETGRSLPKLTPLQMQICVKS
ncbi:helix-turn-helix transcriptional regulator [Phormidesmis priestleyi]|uniref:helix-turn-helix transcriptional regulator n=1 Tax=Phormidesmis priestleyi TaxID=268141 RepID=UPI000B0235D7|nr:helix-turn-helix transcriptional regulator [Phormidesmis priestleyi]